MKLRLWTPDGPVVGGVDYGEDPIWVFSFPERLFGTDSLDRYYRVRYAEADNWGGFIPLEVDE